MHKWLRGFWVTPLELFGTMQAAPQLAVTERIYSSWPFQSLFIKLCWVGASFMAREMGTQRQVLGVRAPQWFPSGGWKWAPLSPRWGHLIHSRFKVGRKKIKTDSKGPLVVSIQCGFPIVSAPQCGFELCPSALSLEGPGWELGYLQTETQ